MDDLEHLQHAYKLAREALWMFENSKQVLADDDYEVWVILRRREQAAMEAYVNAYNARFAYT